MIDNLTNVFGELHNDDTSWVVVTNLDDSIDDYDLREKFENFGHVKVIELPYDTQDPKHGKCARLQFALAPAARAACSKLGGKNWRGKRVQAYTFDRWKRMKDKQQGLKNQTLKEIPVKNKIFVGGLGRDISVHIMRRYFQTFGPIDFRQSKIITDRSGNSKGYGFVVFESEENAQVVLQSTLHWINGKQVNVGPVHEKKIIQVYNNTQSLLNTQSQAQNITDITTNPPQKEKSKSRSRSYHRSSSSSRKSSRSRSSSSRSRSSSSSRSSSNSAQTKPEAEEATSPVPEETPEEIASYQEVVAKQLEVIEEEETKAKTLEQRRKERRERWKKRKNKGQ